MSGAILARFAPHESSTGAIPPHVQRIRECGTCFNGSFSALHLVAEQWKTNALVDPAVWPDMIRTLVEDLGADPNLLDWQPEVRISSRV